MKIKNCFKQIENIFNIIENLQNVSNSRASKTEADHELFIR